MNKFTCLVVALLISTSAFQAMSGPVRHHKLAPCYNPERCCGCINSFPNSSAPHPTTATAETKLPKTKLKTTKLN